VNKALANVIHTAGHASKRNSSSGGIFDLVKPHNITRPSITVHGINRISPIHIDSVVIQSWSIPHDISVNLIR